MTDKPPHLTVIHGTPAPDTPEDRRRRRVKAMPRVQSQIMCHRCGGMEFIQTLSGPLLKDGKVTGGIKILLCAACFMRGERVVVK